jgi:hypothetical protein
MRLMIAVPTTEYMPAGFVKSLCDLTTELNRQKVNYKVEIQSGTLVYIARNKLASTAVNEKYTHVLWLDSDMVFTSNILDDLMFCGKEMVCGAFVSRRPPYGPCVYESIKKYEVEKVKEFGTKPFRVDGCGFACVLTTTELLQAVQYKFGNCFNPTDYYGEDLAFCWRVGQIGREIWCEPTVRPGHIAHVPVYAGEAPFSRTEQAGEGE